MPSNLAAGKSLQVDVDSVYAHALSPFPTKIKQSEKQLVVFTGNIFLYSPYKITSQTTTVNLASSSIESYSKSPKPVSQSEKTVTYGPYETREPFTEVGRRETSGFYASLQSYMCFLMFAAVLFFPSIP